MNFMLKHIKKWAFIFLLWPLASLASPNTVFQENKDYSVLSHPVSTDANAPGKVQVIEFFSYGCPACNHFEPSLEKWLAQKPKYVVFKRIPVMFEPGWDVYAKAYYIADAMGQVNQLTPKIFDAIHQKNQDLASFNAMQQFFNQHGINASTFDNAYNHSPAIDLMLKESNQAMQNYQVLEIPTIIVANQYKVNPSMVKGDNQKMLKIIDYLIQKSRK